MSKIEPTYATFEQAKWLKEKGFLDKNIYGEIRLSQSNFYDPNGILHHIRDAFGEKSFDLKDCYNAPEQWQVVEWLRVNHGIWVCVLIPSETTWYFKIESIDTKSLIFITSGYSSPQEAYSAAFDYILNNLI
jgi:hypothetical protein